MSSKLLERNRQRFLNHIPMNRLGEGEDLQGAVIYLASAASKYVTGIVIPVDGGYMTI